MKRIIQYILLVSFFTSCGTEEPSQPVLQKISGAKYTPFSDGYYARPDTLRLLVIGNSFAKNAVGSYLNEMLSVSGFPCEIGLLHKESASLQMHFNEGIRTKGYYEFYRYDSEGRNERLPNCNLSEALTADKWNCLSFQQASEFSGQYDSYAPYLSSLLNYCANTIDSTFEIFFHQTWAYESDYKENKFNPYGYDQWVMYSKIAECSWDIASEYKFDLLIPSGTAVQNARTSEALSCPTADGCHLKEYSGRYLAACVWYEALTGLDVRDIQYQPAKVSVEEQRIAQESAHAAILAPYSVTPIK